MKKKKEEVKKNINKKELIILITIILLIVIVVVIVLLLRGKTLDTDSELVTEIYSYMGNNDLEVCNGLATYAEDAVEFDDIDNSMRICTAYSLLDLDESTTVKIDKTKKNNTCSIGENITFATDNYEDDICTVTKVESSIINDQYKKMYGKDIENYEQFQYNDTTICYYEDGYYYCGLSESYTTTIGGEPHTFRSIKKVSEKEDEIIIYDYFLKVANNECYTSYTGTTKNDTCSKNYNENDEMSYKFLKKYGTLYKHTYKKNGDNYYWVKSEPTT